MKVITIFYHWRLSQVFSLVDKSQGSFVLLILLSAALLFESHVHSPHGLCTTFMLGWHFPKRGIPSYFSVFDFLFSVVWSRLFLLLFWRKRSMTEAAASVKKGLYLIATLNTINQTIIRNLMKWEVKWIRAALRYRNETHIYIYSVMLIKAVAHCGYSMNWNQLWATCLHGTTQATSNLSHVVFIGWGMQAHFLTFGNTEASLFSACISTRTYSPYRSPVVFFDLNGLCNSMTTAAHSWREK